MKKLKQILNYLNYRKNLVKTVRDLERDVENLEIKLLAPEEVKTRSWFIGLESFSWGLPKRPMSLEEKVDAIAKALKIKFIWTEETEKTVIAKISKKK